MCNKERWFKLFIHCIIQCNTTMQLVFVFVVSSSAFWKWFFIYDNRFIVASTLAVATFGFHCCWTLHSQWLCSIQKGSNIWVITVSTSHSLLAKERLKGILGQFCCKHILDSRLFEKISHKLCNCFGFNDFEEVRDRECGGRDGGM